MIAGRLRWRAPGQKVGIGSKQSLARLEFASGTLFFTEAGTKRRASMVVVRGEAALGALDPRRHRAAGGERRGIQDGAHAREPHPQARADGSAPVQRDRQRLFRRDPPWGAALALEALPLAHGRGSGAASTKRRARRSASGPAAARRGRRWIPREGDGVPRRDGGAWAIPQALPGVRLARAAHRLRRERDATTAPRARRAGGCSPIGRYQAAEGRLAEVDRRRLTLRPPCLPARRACGRARTGSACEGGSTWG